MRRPLLILLLLIVWLSPAFASPAYAYLDPGTGSYVFQMIIAGVVGLLFLVKIYWRRIASLLTRLFPPNEARRRQDEDAADDA